MPLPGPPTPTLDRAHDEDAPSVADVRDEQLALERDLARLAADHPAITLSSGEVLEAAEYDLDELRATVQDLYPERFGGETYV